MLALYLRNLHNIFKILLCLALALLFYIVYTYKVSAPLKNEIVIYIPPNTSSYEISSILYDNHAINSKIVFAAMAKFNGAFGKYLKYGQYKIKPASNASEVMSLLISGDVIKYNLTIPEGLSNFQVINLVNSAYGLIGEIDPLKYKEGWLMPDTYQYTYLTEKSVLLDSMNKSMKDLMSTLDFKPSVIKTEDELIVLASIIEKESKLSTERSSVAAVYLNRLKIGMPLQADPTVIYGLTKGRYDLGRPLLLKDLAIASEYNTYINKGLPPTAISNPGKSSIIAALNPAEITSIYFVADGAGGHKFSDTYKDHQKNVSEYRKLMHN